MTAILSVQDLVVRYDGQPLLHGVGFEVAAGETVALVGESGCGKSTTALAVAGLLPENARAAGRITFEGQDLVAMAPRARRHLQGNRIGMVFQEPLTSLNPVLTIAEQITEVLREHQTLGARAARARALKLLDQVRLPGTARVLDDYPHHLSGGQRQRVMIAIAIACGPRLLIADEPTTALDVTTQATILSLLDELRRGLDMGLLLITHDLGVVAERADRVLVMHGGRVLESATADALFATPQHAYTRGLLGASLRKDQPRHYSRERLAEIRVTPRADGGNDFALTGTARAPQPAPPPAATGAPLLEVRELHKRFHRGDAPVAALSGVGFDLHAGETLGLVGQSGSGKSTLGKIVLRLLREDAGTLRFRGEDITALPERRLKAFRRQAQMVFQDPYGSLNPRQTVGEMLDAVQRLHLDLDRAARHKAALAMLDAVGLPADSLQRYPHEFSGGQRQRIGIARALVLRPALLVCDEPVSALDVSVQAQVLNLLVDLRQAFGLSYLFISHDLSVVRYIADRVMVLNEGSIVESGRHDALWDAPQHPYTRSLIDAVPGRAAVPAFGWPSVGTLGAAA
ncbi:ABC transporter ATP-binding protein [Pseudorhodoferax sp. Leaf274]|uniref:dipeptide ABC transporter ATP-binding protein n=1 Tax=Pseudorhodoferax sp. Leaf274 TaxID=1736318 RepID=UPI00070243F8|nr:ABC transporter ATP-binding protein [Pseudorhodoferax sp. Leaf274]KQP47718.1 glutathione ABC transporter ATP-binding protein [Pseudorhodoferax sp. Leaf274]